jgi:aryl-alcohol dehydrogenase-like predicted oxidoreductase
VGVSAAALAIAFALSNPAVTSALFGATSPSQIGENVAALDVGPDVLDRLGSLFG